MFRHNGSVRLGGVPRHINSAGRSESRTLRSLAVESGRPVGQLAAGAEVAAVHRQRWPVPEDTESLRDVDGTGEEIRRDCLLALRTFPAHDRVDGAQSYS